MTPPETVAADRRRTQRLTALVFVQVFFGLFPVLVKLAQDGGGGFSTHALATWRIGVGSLVLGAVALVRHGRACLPPRSDWARLAVCSVLGIAANQLFALEGAARTSATQAGILFTLIPVFTYAVAASVGQERFELRRSAGIGIALAGAVLLTWTRGRGEEVAPDPVGGSVLLVLNSLVYAIYLVLARKLLDHLPTLVVLAWVFALSLWVPAGFAALGSVELWPSAVTREAWIGLVGLLVFPTVLAYLLNTYALARVSASTTAVFIYLQPLVSVGTAVLVLGERPGPTALLAALLLFAGIGLVVIRRRDRPSSVASG